MTTTLITGASKGLGREAARQLVAAGHTVYVGAAVNMLTVQYAKAFPGIRINAVDPGYTATDLNAHRGTQTVGEGAEIIARMARTGPDGPTGGYFDRRGPVPW